MTSSVHGLTLEWLFLHQWALFLQLCVLEGPEPLPVCLLHQIFARGHLLVVVAIIILLIITHGYKFHLRLPHVRFLGSWLLHKDTVGVSLHVVDAVRGIPCVLEIKLVLVTREFNLLLPRCTLAEVLSFITWLILGLRRADPIYLPYFFSHLVVIEVTWPLNFFVLIKELLISAHNCSWILESNQLFCVWVDALCAIDALVGRWTLQIVFHQVIWGVDGFTHRGTNWLSNFLSREVAGILALYIWRHSYMSRLSWWSRCSVDCLEIIYPGSDLGGLKHGRFTPTLLDAIELIDILGRLPERTIANLAFDKSVNSWWKQIDVIFYILISILQTLSICGHGSWPHWNLWLLSVI